MHAEPQIGAASRSAPHAADPVLLRCRAPGLQVIVATLSGAGSQVLQDMLFKVVVLDEASQATEAATAVPLVRAVAAAIAAPAAAQARAGATGEVMQDASGQHMAKHAAARVAVQPSCGTLRHTAAHSTEDGTVLQVKGVECLVIAGDPCQLAPFVQSKAAYEEKLDVSLFERLQA